MIVVISAAAESDLETIGDFIALDDPARAVSFITALVRRCQMLADLPRRDPLVPRYESTGIRRFVFGHYLVFYRIGVETIDVLRVMHTARDYERLLLPT